MALSLLAANNAQTVLAAGISSSATSLTVNTGTGALFPSPSSGVSFFKLTLIDAATGQLTEIVHVTARSGDTMTIDRAQEGTTARAWSANDIVANMMTAGTLSYILGNFQPLDATLTAIASLTGTADKLVYFNGTDTAALTTLTSAARDFISCLGVPEMRNYLNLGTVALKNVGTGTGQVPDMSSWTSGSGWIKFPDGTIIQSGSQVVAGTTTNSNSPLPIPFTSTNYSLIASFSGSAALPSGPCGGRPNSVSDFVLVNWSSIPATLNWLAIGK
ncbi:gp53-like domain-containing protein [Salmonella enterica]|uniref:gp53-like domain-containing protein n=1 Tax=Salmonella sp. CQ23WZ0145SAL TaxID=3417701 RepID=UPI0034E5C4DE